LDGRDLIGESGWQRRLAMNRRITLAAAFAAILPAAAMAAAPEIFTGIIDGVGAGGYDAVSYFDGARPVEGKAEFSTDWKGATWRFATEANLAAFKSSPEKFAPQFGGYCAYAVSKGATAKGDPLVWTLVDGKLYFNLSSDVKKLWSADIPGNIAKGNANWPAVLQ
jgi:YHS domain-containing protein